MSDEMISEDEHGSQFGCRDAMLDHDHETYSGEPVCADCGQFLDAATVCRGLEAIDCYARQINHEPDQPTSEDIADAAATSGWDPDDLDRTTRLSPEE